MNQGQQNHPANDLGEIFKALEGVVPAKATVEIKRERSGADKVAGYNNKIIEIYLQGELSHLQQQKAVAIIIAIAVGLQLIAFNVLIYLVTLRSYDLAKMELLLDFMKYYTGAVIVEMLGLCWVVVKSIYSMSIGKMAEHIIKRKNNQ